MGMGAVGGGAWRDCTDKANRCRSDAKEKEVEWWLRRLVSWLHLLSSFFFFLEYFMNKMKGIRGFSGFRSCGSLTVLSII